MLGSPLPAAAASHTASHVSLSLFFFFLTSARGGAATARPLTSPLLARPRPGWGEGRGRPAASASRRPGRPPGWAGRGGGDAGGGPAAPASQSPARRPGGGVPGPGAPGPGEIPGFVPRRPPGHPSLSPARSISARHWAAGGGPEASRERGLVAWWMASDEEIRQFSHFGNGGMFTIFGFASVPRRRIRPAYVKRENCKLHLQPD